MVTMRSLLGMNEESTFSVVVLPEPVPPLRKMLRRASTHACRKSNISGDAVPKPIEIFGGEAGRELADGDDRAHQAEGLDDGVDTRAIGQASIHARAGLIDVAAEGRDDAVDDIEHVLVVAEGDVRALDATGSLDVHLERAVDHDLGDARVGQERLDRPEAGNLVDDALDQTRPLVAGRD